MNLKSGQIKDILELLPEMDKVTSEYMEHLFSDAPEWLRSSFYLRQFKKNETIVRENDPVDRVYILIKGRVKGVDYQKRGSYFGFADFSPFIFFGSMEILLGLQVYMTTLKAMSPCILLETSVQIFRKWMESDRRTMMEEVRALGNNLFEQTKFSRKMLFSEGMERILIFLTRQCELDKADTNYRLMITRQDIADCTGLSVRSVNRLIGELKEENLLECRKGGIDIDESQYAEMKKRITDY